MWSFLLHKNLSKYSSNEQEFATALNLSTDSLNFWLFPKNTSYVERVNTGEKFLSSKSSDFNSIFDNILSSYYYSSALVLNQSLAVVS